MGDYIFLEHTADEKFKVTAKSIEDAFATSVIAMHEVLLADKLNTVKSKFEKKVHFKAKKLTTLLYDFLNEIVFLFDDEDLLLPQVKTITIEEKEEMFELNAVLCGDKCFDYELQTEIKNMTYSDMKIVVTSEKVTIEAVVDI